MIARIKLYLALRKRRAVRVVQQADAKRTYWQHQREQWKRDPLRVRA